MVAPVALEIRVSSKTPAFAGSHRRSDSLLRVERLISFECCSAVPWGFESPIECRCKAVVRILKPGIRFLLPPLVLKTCSNFCTIKCIAQSVQMRYVRRYGVDSSRMDKFVLPWNGWGRNNVCSYAKKGRLAIFQPVNIVK